MIAKLTGILDHIGPDGAVIDVGGVGYLCFCSTRTLGQLPPPGGSARLLVETHVREDHIHLYGFIDAVERDCSVIRPQAGHLIFFDARRHPHYSRPLITESDMRVVAVMNFYTESCPESTRPRELNRHLYGDE